MGCIALVRCVLVLRCGSTGVVWYPYVGCGFSNVSTSETGWAVNSEIIKQVTSSWSVFIQIYHTRCGRSFQRITRVVLRSETFTRCFVASSLLPPRNSSSCLLRQTCMAALVQHVPPYNPTMRFVALPAPSTAPAAIANVRTLPSSILHCHFVILEDFLHVCRSGSQSGPDFFPLKDHLGQIFVRAERRCKKKTKNVYGSHSVVCITK